jgi:ribosomal protein L11 methyltransferase
VKTWPALDVRVPPAPDQILAIVDDFSPTAAEERGEMLRVFFASAAARDAAAAAVGATAVPVDVDDEDWAARSQASLGPITVGRFVVLPDVPSERSLSSSGALTKKPDAETSTEIVIRPSMGFGTGHHATTRLCLEALQELDVRGRTVLDVGTGSGILAIAAARLGATKALGIDTDPDAIESADANLTLNPDVKNVRFRVVSLESATLPPADIVLANLTGTLIVREAKTLLAAVRPGGSLLLSGILDQEEHAVRTAFAGADLRGRSQEGEWIGLTFNRAVSCPV